MDIGVAVVSALPEGDWIRIPIIICIFFALLFTAAFLKEKNWGRFSISFAVLLIFLIPFVIFSVEHKETYRQPHDNEATRIALQERYGVSVSDEDWDQVELPRARKYSTITAMPLENVLDQEGGLIEGVYLQHRSGYNQRLALVFKPEGVNELVVTKGTWWPEIPLAGEPK